MLMYILVFFKTSNFNVRLLFAVFRINYNIRVTSPIIV